MADDDGFEVTDVVSSNIAQIGYNNVTGAMRVEFLSGDTYEYQNVPVSVYRAFQHAPSPGSFFYRNVRQRYAGSIV